MARSDRGAIATGPGSFCPAPGPEIMRVMVQEVPSGARRPSGFCVAVVVALLGCASTQTAPPEIIAGGGPPPAPAEADPPSSETAAPLQPTRAPEPGPADETPAPAPAP